MQIFQIIFLLVSHVNTNFAETKIIKIKNIGYQMDQIQWNSLKVLHQKDDDQYEPDQEEIIEYAEYFGLQFPNDIKFLPLLREGLTARLPQQWQACHTPEGSLVYRNTITRQIQQEHPLDQYYRQKILEMKEQDEEEQDEQQQTVQLSVIPEQPRNQSQLYEMSQKNQFPSSQKQKQSQNYFDKNITQYSELDEEINNNQERKSSTQRDNRSTNSNFINKHIYGLPKELQLLSPITDIIQKPKFTYSDDIGSRNHSPTKNMETALQRAYQRQKKLKRQNKRLQIDNIRMEIKAKKQILRNLEKQNKHSFEKLREKLRSKKHRKNSAVKDAKEDNKNHLQNEQNNEKSISLKQLDQRMFELPKQVRFNFPKPQKPAKSRYN